MNPLTYVDALSMSIEQLKEVILSSKGDSYLPGGEFYPAYKYVDAEIDGYVLIPGKMDYIIAAVTASRLSDEGSNPSKSPAEMVISLYDPAETSLLEKPEEKQINLEPETIPKDTEDELI